MILCTILLYSINQILLSFKVVCIYFEFFLLFLKYFDSVEIVISIHLFTFKFINMMNIQTFLRNIAQICHRI